MPSTPKESLFPPLAGGARTSARVAEALRKVILGGELAPGEALPPERALAERFRVTRNTVREALRGLEQLRLVSIRQGSGIRVRDYLTSAGLEVLVDLLDRGEESDHALMAELAEARQVIGRAMNHYAVERLDPGALPALAGVVERLEAEAALPSPDSRRLQDLDFEVHLELIRGSGNRAMLLLHNSVRHIYRRIASLFTPLVEDPVRLARLHRQLLTALERGDRARAKAVVTRYFELGRVSLTES